MTGTINASRIRVMLIDAGTIPLAKCAHLVASHPFRGQIEDIPSGSVRVIQMKDVDPVEGVNWAGMSQTELTGRKGADWLEEGDVIFVPRGTRFYAACLSAPPGPTVCGPHLYHLRVKTESWLLPRFLAWQINQPPIQRKLRAAAEGTSQLSIRRAELEALPICVPSINEQQSIVDLVDLATRERRLFEELIRNRDLQLEAIAASLATAEHNPEQ